VARRTYLTVAEELLEHVDLGVAYFEARGYRVRAEHIEIGFPYAPTLHCKRGTMTVFVEASSMVRLDPLTEWARYARSRNRDTRVALLLPSDAVRAPLDEAKMREIGIGLYLSDGASVVEAITPKDMAVNVELPEIKALPPKMRSVLGPVYEKFERSEWREGFEEACQALEVLARKYLKDGMKSKRVVLVTPSGKLSKITGEKVDRMTVGALADAFGMIQTKNHADQVIGSVLAGVNKDRVGVVHHKRRASTEERLRRNVGQHMWKVVAALKELLNIKK
jgi:hypothetical protein